MSMLQRFLNPASEKPKKDDEIEVCEEIEDGQPHNPYTEIIVLQHHTDIVRLLMQINDRRFISAGDDNKAVIWDVLYGRHIATLEGHSHPITSMILLPPIEDSIDTLIATGSSDRQIKLWDAETGELRKELSEHGTSVRCMEYLNDGLFCACGENLTLWDRSGQLIHSLKNAAAEDVDLMVSIGQQRIATAADKELVVYKLKQSPRQDNPPQLVKLKHLSSHREAIKSLVYVSKLNFASGSLDGMIVLWSAATLQPTKKFNIMMDYEGRHKMYPYSVQMMMCVQERFLFAAVGCGFCVYDVTAGKEHMVLHKQSAHLSKTTCIGFACEGDYLVSCSEDHCMRLWGKKPVNDDWSSSADLAVTTMERFTGHHTQELSQVPVDCPLEPFLLGECSAHGGTVQGFLDFGHGGMVSCGADGLVIIWKNSEMQKVRRNQTLRKLLFSPDGIV